MRITYTLVCLISSLHISAAFADGRASVPPLLQLILDDPSRLERTLASYENKNSSHVFIAAHRGGREQDIADQAPGNSIANIDNALGKGFDIFESDIEILGDGTFVIFHDPTFNLLTNSEIANDTLSNATLDYAKGLFLTYSDNTTSDQKIPTLQEFLTALKGKLMVKFDIKPGVFSANSTQRLIAIMQAAVVTQTTEQVLLRGGENLLNIARDNGFDTRMIMRRYNSSPSVEDIESLAESYAVRAVSIPGGADQEVLAAAKTVGLIVEIHESQNVTDMQRELDWQAALDIGVRQFHSFKPSLLLEFLKDNNLREF